MAACRTCGEPNAESARFCHACGGALDGAELAAPREVRKTVTIIFADVAGSTALGEQLDPEALRSVMSRYYEEMRAALEHHGGTVEKFIGDAVMAVFGAPVAHEDDALRAVRAADDMRNRLGDLNLELERQYGVTLEIRIGVNTGEVVAGDPAAGQALVTGDAVNLAKRLEQAAPAGSILIGKSTYPLVKDAVQAGPLESFSVKGKTDQVSPLRIDAIDRYAPGVARALERRFVGRLEELAALEIALRRVDGEQGCRLFTILGPAGIGKSRLVAEFAAGSGATVLEGRCLPYGEGVTLWPFREIVGKLGGAEGLAAVLAGAEDAEVVVDRVMGAVGASGSAHSEETPWAFRRLLEKIAGQGPLVVMLEDVHWALPAFLDLVEYLLGWLRGPVLFVCIARQDLVELRPEWLNPRPNADTLVLEPLAADEAKSLLAELGADPQAKARIAEAAEGNPLFLEQMAALLAEEQEDAEDVPVPPSIQALLAARLDQLDPAERAVIEQAAVVGREFSRAAVSALSPPELASPLAGALMALVRKKLLLPEASEPAHDDRFRFEHVLIRDAAYEAVPKQRRAGLHERLADWLEEAQAPEELVGYHLEQAYRLGLEVAGLGSSEALRNRAAERLAAAGRKAFLRGDMPAAANLLGRAASLLREEEHAWLELAPDLGVALRDTGDLTRADEVLSAAVERASTASDRRAESLALVERAALRLMAYGARRTGEASAAAESAVSTFTALNDDHGLARAWHLVGRIEWINGRAATMEAALERGLEHARRAGNDRDVATILRTLPLAALFGPRPIEDALSRCAEIRREAAGDREIEAVLATIVGGLEARRGHFDEARRLQRSSDELFRELGLGTLLAGVGMYSGVVERLAGDLQAAERELRTAQEALENLGDHRSGATTSALLADVLHAQGRDDEADRYATASAETASADLVSQLLWRQVRAKVLGRRGELDEAERIAREGVALAAKTDFSWISGDSQIALGTVLHAAGKDDEARDAFDEALRLYEAKGDLVSSRNTRVLLAELRPVQLDRGTATR